MWCRIFFTICGGTLADEIINYRAAFQCNSLRTGTMESDKPPPYEPPQPGFIPPPNQRMSPPPPLAQGNTVPVVITRSVAMPLGPDPSSISCPFCHASIITSVKSEPTTKTHMLAAILCFLGGLLCVWIPYVSKSCQGQTHYCPSCGAYLGKYEN